MSEVKTFRVFISPDGTVEFLYTDHFADGDLGPLQVRRASEVEYDDGMELSPVYDEDSGEILTWQNALARKPAWVATLLDGREIARHVRREEVLKRERAVIEAMLAAGELVPMGPVSSAVPEAALR
jgi:hypothetical protein